MASVDGSVEGSGIQPVIQDDKRPLLTYQPHLPTYRPTPSHHGNILVAMLLVWCSYEYLPKPCTVTYTARNVKCIADGEKPDPRRPVYTARVMSSLSSFTSLRLQQHSSLSSSQTIFPLCTCKNTRELNSNTV